MKRALLIAGGTVGSLGAVLAITPPQISASQSELGAGIDLAPVGGAATSPAASAAPSATASAAPSASVTGGKKETSAPTTKPASSATKAAPSKSAAPAATQTPAADSGKASSGTFLGDPYTMRYGTVQVQITINGGKITDAVAVTAPGGRDQRYTDMAIPVMRQKTLVAQSANITGVSGASYTAYAWYISLQSALKKAGWM